MSQTDAVRRMEHKNGKLSMFLNVVKLFGLEGTFSTLSSGLYFSHCLHVSGADESITFLSNYKKL